MSPGFQAQTFNRLRGSFVHSAHPLRQGLVGTWHNAEPVVYGFCLQQAPSQMGRQ